MRTRVKICGVTRVEDAVCAARAGAEFVGFVFWPASPRAVTPAAAQTVASALPPNVVRVGVFVDAPRTEIDAARSAVPLDVVQLHGDEGIDEWTNAQTVFKLTTLAADADVDAAAGWPSHVIPLVDAADASRRGGTGLIANWSRAAALAARRRIVLAGGLTPENVGDAIRTVRPWAVDVSSGVEERPGIKSAARIAQLIAAVAAADGDRS
jgi:phosphoribosylanthranilate isomerase